MLLFRDQNDNPEHLLQALLSKRAYHFNLFLQNDYSGNYYLPWLSFFLHTLTLPVLIVAKPFLESLIWLEQELRLYLIMLYSLRRKLSPLKYAKKIKTCHILACLRTCKLTTKSHMQRENTKKFMR